MVIFSSLDCKISTDVWAGALSKSNKIHILCHCFDKILNIRSKTYHETMIETMLYSSKFF